MPWADVLLRNVLAAPWMCWAPGKGGIEGTNSSLPLLPEQLHLSNAVPMSHPPRSFQDLHSRHFHQSFLRALVALVLLNLFETCWKVENWHLTASYYLCCIPRLGCTDFPRAAAGQCCYTGCGTWASGAHFGHFLEPDIDPCEESLRKQVWLPHI